MAFKELACEGRGDDMIPVALHTVCENDPIDNETFGIFLNTNSKDFSARFHDKLTYRDILRFCCATMENESDGKVEEVKSFLKKTLKGFSKGSQKFGSLPLNYLNQFEDEKERCAGFLSCKEGSSGKVGRKDWKSHQKALDWVKERLIVNFYFQNL